LVNGIEKDNFLKLAKILGSNRCLDKDSSFQSNTRIHTVRSDRVLTPHNRSQLIQANTTRGFIQCVFVTIGIMMPETC